MSELTTYTLGMVPHNSVENRRFKWWLLTYHPPGSYGINEPRIGFYEGFWPHAEGSSCSPAFWLTYRESHYEKVGDRVVGILAAEGWFERLCQEVCGPWFFPMVQRMAAGEAVPLREIQDAYAAHHGYEMPG